MNGPGMLQLGERFRRNDETQDKNPKKAPPNGITALVVDDDPLSCELVGGILKRIGYTVHLFTGGADALFYCSRAPAGFLLADYKMPEINGYQLGRTIKSRFPKTKVVVMTGLCRSDVAGIMTDPTIDGWLFKPFQIYDLERVLIRIGLPGNTGQAVGLKDKRNSVSGAHQSTKPER